MSEPPRPPRGRPARALTAAIAGGDRDALAEFYELWFDRAFRFARELTGRDESFCLDVVQESMVRVIRRVPVLESEERLAHWYARVLYTTAVDLLRRETRRVRRELRAVDRRATEAEAPAEQAVELRERLRWLEAQLAELPAEERELLRQRFGLELTLREVGEALGLTTSTAAGRIRRVLLRLRAAARDTFGWVF